MLGPGQQNDMAPAYDLVGGLKADQWLADRAYDADGLCALIRAQGGEAVIPPRRHRIIKRPYDVIAYKNRWGIEGFFGKLKQWRRIPPATTNSPPTSSASSNSPASCFG
jgi:transposase